MIVRIMPRINGERLLWLCPGQMVDYCNGYAQDRWLNIVMVMPRINGGRL